MEEKLKVIIVDDERILVDRLERSLKAEGYEVRAFTDPLPALDAVKADPPHLVITDVKMRGMDGIELMQRIKAVSDIIEVIVITGYSSLDAAVEVTKKGAFNYLAKPFKMEQIKLVLMKAAEKVRVSVENERLKAEVKQRRSFTEIVGESVGMRAVFDSIEKVAKVDCNVLIEGESGTGKELVARAIHRESPRKDGPFVSFNCASFTEDLMANELFGHEKGAFTGATDLKQGLLEVAGDGTLFLDEVGDMPMAMQVKLLRVLQEREYLRVGGLKPIRIDVRVIGATNRDIKRLVDEGKFRHDLFYRLNVVFMEIPPLKERKEDVPLLVRHFIKKYDSIFGKKVKDASGDFMKVLLGYSFPGNVRELENILERAVALADADTLGLIDLPPDFGVVTTTTSPEGVLSLREHEGDYIRAVYRFSGGNQLKTAELLGISRTTLWRKLKDMGLL